MPGGSAAAALGPVTGPMRRAAAGRGAVAYARGRRRRRRRRRESERVPRPSSSSRRHIVVFLFFRVSLKQADGFALRWQSFGEFRARFSDAMQGQFCREIWIYPSAKRRGYVRRGKTEWRVKWGKVSLPTAGQKGFRGGALPGRK